MSVVWRDWSRGAAGQPASGSRGLRVRFAYLNIIQVDPNIDDL